MYSNNKLIRDVADIAAQIMSGQQPVTEKLHPNQQKLDVHEPEKDELTADDFKKLRGKKELNKEDVTTAAQKLKAALDRHTEHAVAANRAGDHDAVKVHQGYANKIKTQLGKLAKNEESEIDEASRAKLTNYISAAKSDEKKDRSVGIALAQKKKWGDPKYGTVAAKVPANEEVEELDEIKLADLPVRKIQGRAYGASTPEPHAVDTMEGPRDSELKKIAAEKKKKKFSEMVNLYQDKGLKSLSEMLAKEEVDLDEEDLDEASKLNTLINRYTDAKDDAKSGYDTMSDRAAVTSKSKGTAKTNRTLKRDIKYAIGRMGKPSNLPEEVTEDEFNKEIEDAKAKDAGKKKNTEIAKGAVQAVKNEETHTTVEFIDLNDVNGVRYSEIELAQERTLTPAETDKKEEIVKSMKKGLSGFKDRYGDRAKEVMYATATANAKNE
jgi:hypothetical protein